MKIQYMSDLHLEFKDMSVPCRRDMDVVILCGDICTSIHGIFWASKFKCPVIYIAGNHEFYSINTFQDTLKELRVAANLTSNVIFLENDSVIIEDVQFFGCTLWSDFEIFDNAEHEMERSLSTSNDYFEIEMFDQCTKFTPYISKQICLESRRQLYKNVLESKAKYKVIVTHFLPSKKCLCPTYLANSNGAAMVADCEAIMGLGVDYWFYGHDHSVCRSQIYNTKLLTNQRGYYPDNLHMDFNPYANVELKI